MLTILVALAAAGVSADTDAGYRHYVAGNADDVETETRGLIVMQGGGTDVDVNYSAMGEAGGGGDFVVLRASQADEYNEYILERCGCDSVETIVFESRDAAFDDFVVESIRNAEALFIAGGDQSRYVRFWKGTPVEDAIHFVANKPAPVGGTSAGMAIMGEIVYAALSDASLDPADALADPYHVDVTLERDFLELPTQGGIVTDQHWIERDRMGRTLAMLGRMLEDGWANPARAIAADRETALHVDPANDRATVHATANHETPYVYFLEASGGTRKVEPGTPLTLESIDVRRLAPGDTFDLGAWRADGGIGYSLSVIEGRIESTLGDRY